MRIVIIPLALMAIGTAMPAAAQNYPDRGPDRSEDRDRDRAYVDRGELNHDRRQVDRERRDVQDARRFGSDRDVRVQQRQLQQAKQEYRQDGRDWNRGRNYNYNRPDPRYGAYYADNYYRGGGNYRARPLTRDDRVYRGRDNRYYCRRSDGTTGLIVGAVGGGVLGNIIAPGGSKTLGSLIGGGLGAVLGSSIDRGNVTCR